MYVNNLRLTLLHRGQSEVSATELFTPIAACIQEHFGKLTLMFAKIFHLNC